MSNFVVIDSSALVSLASVDDQNHSKAKAISSDCMKKGKTVILPSGVLSETLNIVGKKFGRSKQLDLVKDLLFSDAFAITEGSLDICMNAFEKLKNQALSVSFTDCLVMVFADKYKTEEVFGFDEAFGKNGYKLPGAS